MNIQILSTYECAGGAGRAANRLHLALVEHNHLSTMTVSYRQSNDWRVSAPTGKAAKLAMVARTAMDFAVSKLHGDPDSGPRSAALLGRLSADEINKSSAEIVNMHWTGLGLISIEQIGKITKPLVWTFHDMWGFCGAEHLAPDDESVRWRKGYSRSTRQPNSRGLDIDRWVWGRKQRAWKNPIHVVCPSRWLAKCVNESALMRDWPISIIPNVLDTSKFKPIPKDMAREILNLPRNAKLVMFGALGGVSTSNKGWDLLASALSQLKNKIADVQGVVFGQGQPKEVPDLGIPLHWMGHVHDEVMLALLYNAADVMVVPSRQENLPQSGTEAHACGCPVVAFSACGLPDVVEHLRTGYLAKAYETSDLANGIVWVISDPVRHSTLSENARLRAERLWSPRVVMSAYLDLYERIVAEDAKMREVEGRLRGCLGSRP